MYGLIPLEQWGNWLESGIVLNKTASRVSQVWAYYSFSGYCDFIFICYFSEEGERKQEATS